MDYVINIATMTIGLGVAYQAAGMEPRGPWDHRKRISYIIASIICASSLIAMIAGAAGR